MRDGDWKLVRPAIRETFAVPDIQYLQTSMYDCEYFLRNGVLRSEPPPPPPAELYNLAADPLEQHNLAGQDPDRVTRMLRELETWFEEVEAERATIPAA